MMLSYGPPTFLTAARMILAGLILMVYLHLKRRTEFRLTKRQVFSLALLAIFSIYLTNICEFWGLKYLSAAKACFIYSLSPFFAAIFSYFHFKEKMSPRKWIGFAIGFLGFIPVLLNQSGAEDLLSVTSWLSLPELAVMGAALFSVYGWVILRVTVKDQNVTPLMANGASMLFGGFLALIHSFFIDAWSPLPVATHHLAPLALTILSMTFISNIVCFNLYGYLLKRFTATLLSFVGLLSPIFASLSSWALLGETPSWVIFAGTSIMLFGMWIVYKAELRQGYIQTPAAA